MHPVDLYLRPRQMFQPICAKKLQVPRAWSWWFYMCIITVIQGVLCANFSKLRLCWRWKLTLSQLDELLTKYFGWGGPQKVSYKHFFFFSFVLQCYVIGLQNNCQILMSYVQFHHTIQDFYFTNIHIMHSNLMFNEREILHNTLTL